jgi:transcriptional regulator with XRE-family HTH domain
MLTIMQHLSEGAMISLGRNLREARESQSLSLRQTAGRAGISAAYLSRIESGKVKAPKPETIKAIARVLGLDMDGIFRLSASLDPELSGLLESNPEVIQLLRLIAANKLNKMEIELIRMFVRQYVLPRR